MNTLLPPRGFADNQNKALFGDVNQWQCSAGITEATLVPILSTFRWMNADLMEISDGTTEIIDKASIWLPYKSYFLMCLKEHYTSATRVMGNDQQSVHSQNQRIISQWTNSLAMYR